MKTFKMISVEILHDGNYIDYPLIDGIIINQENSHHLWILELFINKEYKNFFEERIQDNELLEAKVVISYPENEPASFLVDVASIKQIDNNISVLLKGRLKRARTQYAEQLLEELIDEGLGGRELLDRFEADMLARPRLKKDYKDQG